jgi:two-component system LytT family response regulator
VSATPSSKDTTFRAPLTRLLLKSADRIVLVSVTDVDWFEAADYYVRVHHGGQRHFIRETMTELDQRLEPTRFFRIHRSAIVNLDRVHALMPAFRGDHIVVLHNGTRLVLSRARRSRFEQALGQRL